MIDQNSSQSDVMSNGGGPSPSLSPAVDAASAVAGRKAAAIHDAFLLGWSIQELKSRVLLGALGLESSSPVVEKPVATQASQVAAPAAPASPTPLSTVDTLLHALLPPALAAVSAGPAPQKTAGSTNSKLVQTNDWRAIFIRVAVIHSQCFPASTTANTPYDPSPTRPINETFPYLYPDTTDGSSDYALVGINETGSVGISNFGDDQQMGNFALYDVTRRALNCLALLYMNAVGSLIPDVITGYQKRIVQSIFSHVQASEIFSDVATQDSLDKQVLEAVAENLEEDAVRILQAYVYETSAHPSQEALNLAIKILSFLVARFLESWYGYQRENFYVGGHFKNNELELLGYEAGCSLSSFSWSISLMTTLLEKECQREPDSLKLQERLSATWLGVFQNASLNLVERQISALGPALDDAFFVLKKVSRPAAGEKPGPEQPSRAIHAITYSLTYWQRAIQWICQPSPATMQVTTATPVTVDTTTKVEAPASTAVVNTTADAQIRTTTTITAALADENAGSPTLTVELSQQLRQALVDQAGIWCALMLGEQTLNSFDTESVTRRIMSTIMQNFENTVRQEVTQRSDDTAKRYRVPIIAGGIVLLVILAGGAALLALTGQLQSLVAVIGILVGGIITTVTAFFTRLNSLVSPPEGQGAAKNIASTAGGAALLGGLLTLAGGEVASIFQNAYKQIRLEFDDLNHNVAISYPLIDFFVLHSPKPDQEIKDGYVFLTKVVLPNNELKDDIDNVSRAAFGPLGTLLSSPQNLITTFQNVSKPGVQNPPK